MSHEDPKAGTDEGRGSAGDDAEKEPKATASDSEDAGDDDEKVSVPKREYLSLKQEREAVNNQLKRENEELRERLRAEGGSATDRPRVTDEERIAREMDENYAELVERSRPFTGTDGRQYAGDPAARAVLMLIHDRVEQRRETADDRYLLEATTIDPDSGDERLLTPQERREVREMKRKNPQHFGSAEAALDGWEGRRARQTMTKTAKEKREAAEIVKGRERDDVVRTHRRDETGGEARERHMTSAAFQKQLSKLEEAGDTEKAWKLRQDVARGRVTLSE